MSELWRKAQENAEAARLLFAHAHYNAATNRAYYAMFTAARALLTRLANVDLEAVKRHATVIRLFSLHFVREGMFDAEVGRALNRAADTRAAADYSDMSVDAGEAAELLAAMENLLSLAATLLSEGAPR